MTWQTALALDSYRANSEDRAAVIETPFGLVAMVADGVGGRAGGGAAAEFFLQAASHWAASLSAVPSSRDLHVLLRHIDMQLIENRGLGETTAVFVVASETGIAGAAIGDSVAWWIDDSGYVDLTRESGEKPWLGSGVARVHCFGQSLREGTLMIATDGISKYADPKSLCAIVRRASLDSGPHELIQAVRFPSGKLADDVAVVLARPVLSLRQPAEI